MPFREIDNLLFWVFDRDSPIFIAVEFVERLKAISLLKDHFSMTDTAYGPIDRPRYVDLNHF